MTDAASTLVNYALVDNEDPVAPTRSATVVIWLGSVVIVFFDLYRKFACGPADVVD